jgi:hypothetical protein
MENAARVAVTHQMGAQIQGGPASGLVEKESPSGVPSLDDGLDGDRGEGGGEGEGPPGGQRDGLDRIDTRPSAAPSPVTRDEAGPAIDLCLLLRGSGSCAIHGRH